MRTTVEQLLLIVDRAERGSMLAEEAVLLRAGIRQLAREGREGACAPVSRPNSSRGSTGTTGAESASEAHSASDPISRAKGDGMSRTESRAVPAGDRGTDEQAPRGGHLAPQSAPQGPDGAQDNRGTERAPEGRTGDAARHPVLTWAQSIAARGAHDATVVEVDVDVPDADEPAPLEIPRADAELLHRKLGDLLGVPASASLRADLDQLHRDCDGRDETIRNLAAGLAHEREQVARLEEEIVAARSTVDRVRTLATQMRDWYEPRSVVSGWGRQVLEALDASPAASPQVVVDESPAEAAQAADLPTVIHRTPGQLRQQRAELIASTGLDETVLRERGETFQLYPEHADAWQTVQGIDYLLAGETRTVEHPHA